MVYAYVQWLYSRKIFFNSIDSDGTPNFTPLARLYVLGEKLLDDTFQDCVVSEMFRLLNKKCDNDGMYYFPGNEEIVIIYEGTGSSSPARRFLVDLFVWNGESDWVAKGDEDDVWPVPEEFKDDLIKATLDKCVVISKHQNVYEAIFDGLPCTYHKHGESKCCAPK